MWWKGGRKQAVRTETGFKTKIHTYTYKVKWKSHQTKAALCSPPAAVLTCVNESSRSSFAELFGFVGQCDFYDPRDVPRRGLHTDGMRSNQLGETFGGEMVIAICKGLILQLSYQLSINNALKHIVNLSMFKYNLAGTCMKDTDNNIYKCSEHSHNNFIRVFLHGRHSASWFEEWTWPNEMIYLLQDILWKISVWSRRPTQSWALPCLSRSWWAWCLNWALKHVENTEVGNHWARAPWLAAEHMYEMPLKTTWCINYQRHNQRALKRKPKNLPPWNSLWVWQT